MIPERNLLREKVGLSERKPLYDELTNVIKTGPKVVLRCNKIEEAKRLSPNEVASLRKHNCAFEMLYMFFLFRPQTSLREDAPMLQDMVLQELSIWMGQLAMSERWPPYIQRKLKKSV